MAFGLHGPPLFQKEDLNRDPSSKKTYRERLSSLNPPYARVAPYAHQVIFYLHEYEAVQKIKDLCHWDAFLFGVAAKRRTEFAQRV